MLMDGVSLSGPGETPGTWLPSTVLSSWLQMLYRVGGTVAAGGRRGGTRVALFRLSVGAPCVLFQKEVQQCQSSTDPDRRQSSPAARWGSRAARATARAKAMARVRGASRTSAT